MIQTIDIEKLTGSELLNAVSIARLLADKHGRENVKLAKLGDVA